MSSVMGKVGLLVLLGTLAAFAQQPETAPTSRPAEVVHATPADAVRAYVTAVVADDLLALATTYIAPLDELCRIMDRLRRGHAALVEEMEIRFGVPGRRAVDDERFRVRMTSPFVDVEIQDVRLADGEATVRCLMRIAKQDAAVPLAVDLRQVRGSWRIHAMAGRSLVPPDGAQQHLVEWSVAAEATERTYAFVRANGVREPADAARLRDENMRRVTEERIAETEKPAAPASHPTSRPGTGR